MKTFALDIIPRMQKYSKRLDDISILTNQHWVVFSSIETTKSIYIFRKNNELIVSTNGKVAKGKWEYLGNNSLLVDLDNQSFLYKHGFIDSDILALKTDNNNDYALLLNENKFEGQLNSIKDINKFLEKKYLNYEILDNPQHPRSPNNQTDFQNNIQEGMKSGEVALLMVILVGTIIMIIGISLGK